MNFNIKKLISYIFTINLKSAVGQVHEKLKLNLQDGRYQLETKQAIQSFDDLYTPLLLGFDKIQLQEKSNTTHVLILGLGLGSAIKILENKFKNIIFDFTAVELEAILIQWFKDLYPSDNVNCIHANALEFVQNTTLQFDLIVSDLFVENKVPIEFLQENYLLQLKRLCRPNAQLVINTQLNTEINQSDFEILLNRNFTTVEIIKMSQNMIYILKN